MDLIKCLQSLLSVNHNYYKSAAGLSDIAKIRAIERSRKHASLAIVYIKIYLLENATALGERTLLYKFIEPVTFADGAFIFALRKPHWANI